MNTFFPRLCRWVGMWVVLALLTSSTHAQIAGSKGYGDAPELASRSGRSAALATFIVNSTADAVDAAPGNGLCATSGSLCTLRAAIQEANALAGADIIGLPAGTYMLTLVGAGEDAAATGDLDIRSNTTLTGAGAAATVIDGNWADRVLHVTGAHTVNIAGVTITHGNTGNNASGGGIRNDQGALTIEDSAVSDNNSGAQAGGILSSGTVIVSNSTFSENNARTDAGGILTTGMLTVANSIFVDNNAGANGGAIFSSGALMVTGGAFSDNNTRTGGGAIFSSGTLTAAGSTFSGNNADSGGGIYDGGGLITITHGTFTGNTASTGGGVFAQFDVTIANSTFSNDDAWHGDDIYVDSGALTVVNSTIFGRVEDPDSVGRVGNLPAVGGGGIYNSGGTVTLRNTIIAGHAQGGNCTGVIANGGHNLEDGATCGWGSANGSMSITDPLLGALSGSPAYFPLTLGSPAIDTGQNAICAAAPVNNTSQNGVTRPADGDGNGSAICDMGAFEAPGSVAPTPTPTRTATPTPTPSVTATATPTPTGTPVAHSHGLYLPLILR